MAEEEHQWLLWAKKYKEQFGTLSEQVNGLGQALDDFQSIWDEVGRLRQEVITSKQESQEAKQAITRMTAQFESDIVEANFRIKQLENDNQAMKTDLEKTRAEAQNMAGTLQEIEDLNAVRDEEIGNLHTEHQHKAEEFHNLKSRFEKSLAAVHECFERMGELESDMRRIDNQILSMNASVRSKSCELFRDGKRYLNERSRRERDCSGEARPSVNCPRRLNREPSRTRSRALNRTTTSIHSRTRSRASSQVSRGPYDDESRSLGMPSHNSYANDSTATIEIVPPPFSLSAQLDRSLEEYIDYGVRENGLLLYSYDHMITEAFIDGLQDEEQRTVIKRRLDEIGDWSWQSAMKEIVQIEKDTRAAAAHGTTRKRKQPSAPAPLRRSKRKSLAASLG